MRIRGRFCESGTRCFVLLYVRMAAVLRGARVARGDFGSALDAHRPFGLPGNGARVPVSDPSEK